MNKSLATQAAWVRSRWHPSSVTKLGKILPFGRFFSLGAKFISGVNLLLGDFLGKILFTLGDFFPSLFTIGRFFSDIWANFFQTVWSHCIQVVRLNMDPVRENWIAYCFHADKKAILAAPSMGEPGVSARNWN